MNKLYSVRFSRKFIEDPRAPHPNPLIEGVEYIVNERNIEVSRKFIEPIGIEPFDSCEEIQPREWDRKETLNGKRCLFISLGGLGDALSHTALIGHAKRLYPKSSWGVFCTFGGAKGYIPTSDMFIGNPNIETMFPKDFPIPRALWETYDYHFVPYGLIAQRTDKGQPNFYEILSEWMFGEKIDAKYCVPELYLNKNEELMAQMYIAQYCGNRSPVKPFVIQINTSKHDRNPPPQLWINLLHALQSQYTGRMIFLFGEGEYAKRFAAMLQNETFYYNTVRGDKGLLTLPPFFFNFIDSSGQPMPSVTTFYKMRGDFGLGQRIQWQNNVLSIRAAASIMRDAIVIAPDSSFVHLAAAMRAPCIALYGSFAPETRINTYEKVMAIYKPHECALAPCSYHGEGLPEGCPAAEYCAPLTAISAEDIMKAVEYYE